MCVFLFDFHEYLNIWKNFSESFKIEISRNSILWYARSLRTEGRMDRHDEAGRRHLLSERAFYLIVFCKMFKV